MKIITIKNRDILKGLDDQQINIVKAPFDMPIVVLAGPGSGKTRVIAHRFAYMIQNDIDPSEIIAVTFSSKAAEEIYARVSTLIPFGVDNVCTIHAFFKRLLRAWDLPNAKIEDWKVRDAIQRAASALNWDVGYRYVRWWIDRAKMNGCTTGDQARVFFNLHNTILVEKLTMCFIEVQRLIQQEKKITFADMVSEVYARTSTPSKYLEDVKSRYKYVLIDEGQDTFAIAVDILRKIFGNNYFIVGDPDQTLYRFTGADPEANLFANHRATIMKMSYNYRSVPDIVTTARNFIANNYARTQTQRVKRMIPIRSQDGSVAVKLFDTFSDETIEARNIARQITELVESKYCAHSDIFVAARTNAQLVFVERELTLLSVPNVTLGSAGFFSQKHIRQVINYMRLAFDHNDDDAFRDVYNIASASFSKPHRWLGQKFIDQCSILGGSLWDGMPRITDQRYQSGISDLINFVESIPVQTPLHAVSHIIDQCYKSHYTRTIGNIGIDPADDDNVFVDLNSLLHIVEKYDTTAAFLDYVQQIQEIEDETEDFDRAVVLSTIHKLKGLERKVVFVIGVSDGLLPHFKSFDSNKSSSELPLPNLCSIRDERSIFFVAMTRAADRLFISHIQTWNGQELKPSRFLFEAGLLKESKHVNNKTVQV